MSIRKKNGSVLSRNLGFLLCGVHGILNRGSKNTRVCFADCCVSQETPADQCVWHIHVIVTPVFSKWTESYGCESERMPLEVGDAGTVEEDVLPRLHLEVLLPHLEFYHFGRMLDSLKTGRTLPMFNVGMCL